VGIAAAAFQLLLGAGAVACPGAAAGQGAGRERLA
jgi:hypothetical protein